MIVDTTIIIDFLRRKTPAIQFLDETKNKASLITHPVVVAETLQGARNKKEQREIEALFRHFSLVNVEPQDLRDSIVRLTGFSLSHGVGWHDCIIAATAHRLACPIATLNTADFVCFGDIKVIRPY